MKRNRASELRAIAEGRLMLNVRNGVTVSRSMLAMIADEIGALRAAPLTPAEAGGLVKRLRKKRMRVHDLSGVGYIDDPECQEAADAIEALTAALASERAAHAETKRELADYQRATNTVDAHETANVSDKPEGQQEPVARGVIWFGYNESTGEFTGEYCTVKPHNTHGMRPYIPYTTRPSEQAVTEAMELARAVLAQSITAGHNVPGPTPEDIEKAFWALDAALKAAMEAGG